MLGGANTAFEAAYVLGGPAPSATPTAAAAGG